MAVRHKHENFVLQPRKLRDATSKPCGVRRMNSAGLRERTSGIESTMASVAFGQIREIVHMIKLYPHPPMITSQKLATIRAENAANRSKMPLRAGVVVSSCIPFALPVRIAQNPSNTTEPAAPICANKMQIAGPEYGIEPSAKKMAINVVNSITF